MRAIVARPTHAVSFAHESLRVAVDANHTRSAELADAYRLMILSQLEGAKKRPEAWPKRR